MSSRARSITLAAISNARRSVVAMGKIARQCVVELGKQARFAAIAVVKWVRKLLTAGVSYSRLLGRSVVRGINSKGLRLIAAVVLFLGWMSYLGYAALTKSRSPIVSHAQAAAATLAVVAEVETDQDGKPSTQAKVVESLTANGPVPGTVLFVPKLSEVRGFNGTGQYLLLLESDLPPFTVVGQLRSPGTPDLTRAGKPTIYRWNDDVRKQYEQLHPKK
jgi:hypothetical protein